MGYSKIFLTQKFRVMTFYQYGDFVIE